MWRATRASSWRASWGTCNQRERRITAVPPVYVCTLSLICYNARHAPAYTDVQKAASGQQPTVQHSSDYQQTTDWCASARHQGASIRTALSKGGTHHDRPRQRRADHKHLIALEVRPVQRELPPHRRPARHEQQHGDVRRRWLRCRSLLGGLRPAGPGSARPRRVHVRRDGSQQAWHGRPKPGHAAQARRQVVVQAGSDLHRLRVIQQKVLPMLCRHQILGLW